LETVPVQKWEGLGEYLQVPVSIQVKIRQDHADDSQCMEMVMKCWLQNHPAPSWKFLAEVLYWWEEFTALEVVQKKYIKSVSSDH